jgi:hypothetical protein
MLCSGREDVSDISEEPTASVITVSNQVDEV